MSIPRHPLRYTATTYHHHEYHHPSCTFSRGPPASTRNSDRSKGLISFSEATRFTARKYEESIVWCKEAGKPQPMHLLYPRTKGFITTVQHLRKAPHVKAIYDLTIAYQRGDDFHVAPSMWDTLSVPGLSARLGYKFQVHVRRFPIEELPYADEQLAKWLEMRWVEKGVWLEEKRTEWAESRA